MQDGSAVVVPDDTFLQGCSEIRVVDERPGVEDLIAWRNHSSPHAYGQALAAKDAKDAREGQLQESGECSNPVQVSAL
jgi:hypothetical protein